MKARIVASALLPALAALGISGATGTVGAPTARQPPGQSAVRYGALTAYQALPSAFVPNAGQLDPRVRFSAQAGSTSVFLTRREAVLAIAKGRRELALRLRFLGANPTPTLTGARRSPGRVNYLIGNDPAGWQTNLPTYRDVVYHELWPGIELRVRGQGGQLKYEFRLGPSADPSTIRLAYGGQERLALGRDEALRIETALGLLRDSRPVSFQPIAGKRVAVRSSFVLGRGGAYGFDVGAYDPRYPLVIDPGLVYSTFLGGGGRDGGSGIAVDGTGSAYVTGFTESTNFPTTAGAFDRSSNGGDAFVTKLDPGGSGLVYSTYLGGSNPDGGSGIAVDPAGSPYVTGRTESPDFPTTAGAFDRSLNDRDIGDVFVAKLDAAGSGLAYSTYLGGGFYDLGHAITVDGTGSAYVTGSTESTDFPTTPGAFDRSFNGADAFVTKLDPGGSRLAYSTYLGGSDWEESLGIAVDGAGSAYVTGETSSPDFPTTADAFDRGNNGADAFVTKLDPAGSGLVYSTYLGGASGEESWGIAVDGAGSAYLTGSTFSKDFPTTVGAFDRRLGGGMDAFVAKLNPAGSSLAYSTFLGGGTHESRYGIAVDGAGRAYVAGEAWATEVDPRDFPTTVGAFDRRLDGDSDTFVAKLSPAGSSLAYSTFLGGSGGDWSSGIAIDGAGSAYVTGWTSGTDFPTTTGVFDRSFNGGTIDAFVTKLDLIAGPAQCRVPRVIGMKLGKAKRTIRAAHCSVGRVRGVRSPRVGRVLRQSPLAGAVRKRGFKVNLFVGRP